MPLLPPMGMETATFVARRPPFGSVASPDDGCLEGLGGSSTSVVGASVLIALTGAHLPGPSLLLRRSAAPPPAGLIAGAVAGDAAGCAADG